MPVAFQVPSSKARPSQSAAILSSAFSMPNFLLALQSESTHGRHGGYRLLAIRQSITVTVL